MAICEEGWNVTYVITEPCIGVRDASCVAVCPVDGSVRTQNTVPQNSIEVAKSAG